jgi:glycosyltransferase involved in cell wall biosynthesis
MEILFFAIGNSSFIKKDLDILRSEYNVKEVSHKQHNLFRLIKDIKESRLLFIWFGSLNFFLACIIAKLLRKRLIIVAGGYDVANVPEINYGSFSSFPRKQLVLLMFKMANKIISVSQSNYNELIKEYPAGVDKVEMIYHGFNIIEPGIINKENIILTVGYLDNSSYHRKGFDRFLNLAENMPHIHFHHIGKVDQSLDLPEYPNLTYHGYLSDDEFIRIIKKAKIYLQLSRHEGFGCSVAEAMQYGCIPVVSSSYALPEVVGDCGVVISDPDDMEIIKNEVSLVFEEYTSINAMKCIERVNKEFSLENRKRTLIKLINSTL